MTKVKIQTIILAAGKSSRFRSGKSKLLEQICGQELLLYVTTLFERLLIPITVVVGHEKKLIEELVRAKHSNTVINFITQAEQNGTGHALFCSQSTWTAENILVINGDMPLVTESLLQRLIKQHETNNATITFVTAHNADPSLEGYGRVIHDNNHIKIVEARDFSGDTHEHCCINAGIYLFNSSFLKEHSKHLTTHNAAHELYITDLIKIASDHGHKVETISTSFDTIRGVNTYRELWIAEQLKRSELISLHMNNGVRFCSPQNTQLDLNVSIAPGTIIGNGVHIAEETSIDEQCIIEPFCTISNSKIGKKVIIRSHTVIKNSTIMDQAVIGPFAHLHEGSSIETKSAVGNFVEIKRSSVGTATKIKHLTYVGDAILGDNVNIGAGTIFCNYDGKNKHTTTVKDHAFIGSNNTLIAPVTLGKNCYTAGGSVINKDVPDNALAIGRATQVIKENYTISLQDKEKSTHPSEKYDKEKISFIAAMKIENNNSL
jgi:bifunctional UDP-N-acetylglucosamine pyrophosphorylase / glucosamine-1-phosphate N-acetyltransferase